MTVIRRWTIELDEAGAEPIVTGAPQDGEYGVPYETGYVEVVPLADYRGAVSLLGELVDPDPCRYDHHDLCQAHSLDARPCPHERAKALIADGGQ